MKGTQSWGHQIITIPIAQRTWAHGTPCICASGGRKRCPNQIAYFTCYSYITGRGGRVGRARKWACTEHAVKFAEKHGLPFDPNEEIPQGVPGMSAAVFLAQAENKR
jgi:hypothetical protein